MGSGSCLPRAYGASIWPTFRLLLVWGFSCLLLLSPAAAAYAQKDVAYVYGSDADGVTRQLAADRTPALYTADFGDCLGGKSRFNITKFDAAYYADNMTVVFHLDGTSNLHNEPLMLAITMIAYGEVRYARTPCPLNASVPLRGYGFFALEPRETAAIPAIALQIPDFDGFVTLQIFSNTTQSEIGCFQAAMANGNTLALPAIVAPTLAVFVLVALVASFATASYGLSVPLMRAHYAHALSVVLVAETLQTVFLTGALALHWPSVLVAWWSNFAWSAGLVNAGALVASLGPLTGVAGNASQVGQAGPAFAATDGTRLAGQIYGTTDTAAEVSSFIRRKVYNASDPYDYAWGGDPVLPGVPLPGTWYGFAGTLSALRVPAASAFTLCLVWMAVTVLAFPVVVLAVKALCELCVRLRWVQQDRLAYFRTHYRAYAVHAGLRTLLAAFVPLTTLAVFQLTLRSAPGSTALAALVFALFVGGLAWACACALRDGRGRGGSSRGPAWLPVSWTRGKRRAQDVETRLTKGKENGKLRQLRQQLAHEKLGLPPHSGPAEDDETQPPSTASATTASGSGTVGVHQNDDYIKRFGWLGARYRADRWWFFAVYLLFQLVRACILGGGGTNDPVSGGGSISSSSGGGGDGGGRGNGRQTAQVLVLVLFDGFTLLAYAYARPLEGRRNTAAGVWILGGGRLLVSGLCIGLLPQTGLSRIGATVVGFAIVVVQVLALAAVLVLVVVGAVSSWLSLTRNHDGFQSELFSGVRQRYLAALLASATGAPAPPATGAPAPPSRRQQRKEARRAEREEARQAASLPVPAPTFRVLEVRRAPKIEDLPYYSVDDGQDGDGVVVDDDDNDVDSSIVVDDRQDRQYDTNAAAGSSSGDRSSTNDDTQSDVAAPSADTDDDDDNDNDTLGDLGDVPMLNVKRRRANSGSGGNSNGVVTTTGGSSSASLVGAQIYDPARPHQQRRLAAVGVCAAGRCAVGRPVGQPLGSSPLRVPPFRSASAPLVSPRGGPLHMELLQPLADWTVPVAVLAPGQGQGTAGSATGRMTPTRETLERHASERTSLPTPLPRSVAEEQREDARG
ncbi:intradiol ring-cleavage dioxygenase [Niveomyces insectorum RCEF 264]|uniref:Intradiol ring-cleavage dioxygenase n=1 Tax=Niveomyces insectorum RCEF 264 TaxID=1081102 RepID=A0A167WC92_9HYPO|nr:intradiol ring-cleavage dioxygenase [Niveomyces insectorum RCEF 264]